MKTSRIVTLVGLLALGAFHAEARTIRVDKNPDCPDVGSFEYFQEDNTQRVFLLITRCDGSTCLAPFTGPIQPQRVLALPISLPTNWISLMNYSEVNTTPGAELAIYIKDANGIETHFRNPVDSAEEAYYRMLLMNERTSTGLARVFGPPVSKQEYAAQGVRLREQIPTPILKDQPRRDQSVGNEIFRLYLDRRYGPRPTAEEAVAGAHEDLRIMGDIDVNQSNLLIQETPSGANGYLLKVFPIAPELVSDITVSRADGTIVWSGGNVPDVVSIDLSGQPSGMYFVRGLGKSIVVNVVR